MIYTAENPARRPYDHLADVPWLHEPRRIYVASSWRNTHQPAIVAGLMLMGHQVYDFHQPAPDNNGFRWTDCHGDHATTIESFLAALTHPVAERGYDFDISALDWADTCVMVLPCGRSAHLEAGYAAGKGKRVIWWLHPDRFEPELMYLMGHDFVIGAPTQPDRTTDPKQVHYSHGPNAVSVKDRTGE